MGEEHLIEGHNWNTEMINNLSLSERRISGDQMIGGLLDIEGVDRQYDVYANRSELDQTCINTFRCLLDEQDPRWRLVYKMQKLKEDGILEGSHLEHALRADYLSDHSSIRRGFSRYIDEVTIPQLARAMANLEIGHKVTPLLSVDFFPLSKMFKTEFGIGQIGSRHKPDERGVMGCQEALWQLQIFERRNDQFFGRIGFNFHWENKKPIVSITNIQGVPDDPEGFEMFESLAGQNFGESLVHTLKTSLREDYIYRGVKGRVENPAFYNMVFRRRNIPQYKVKRLYGEKYVPSFEELFSSSDEGTARKE